MKTGSIIRAVNDLFIICIGTQIYQENSSAREQVLNIITRRFLSDIFSRPDHGLVPVPLSWSRPFAARCRQHAHLVNLCRKEFYNGRTGCCKKVNYGGSPQKIWNRFIFVP
jgi:hypothetical protein